LPSSVVVFIAWNVVAVAGGVVGDTLSSFLAMGWGATTSVVAEAGLVAAEPPAAGAGAGLAAVGAAAGLDFDSEL
jgi:hypothetical protein